MRLSLIPNKVMPIMWRMTLCSHRTSTIVLVCLLPVLLGSCLGGGSLNGVQQLDNVIEKLRAKIASSQIGKDDSNIFFKKQFGVYPCDIRFNFCCSSAESLIRDSFSVFDNNAFVTLWVTSILLEAARFRDGPLPSDEQLLNALTAVNTFRDKNRPDDGVLVFWPQTLNSTTGVWSCGPENLGKMGKTDEAILDYLHKIFDDLGMEEIWQKYLEPFQQFLLTGDHAFHIPADFDDTFVNIGLGALLARYASNNHSSAPYEAWSKSNTDFTRAMALLKKYAYRPHSGKLDNGMVDPRTYLYIKDYLYQTEAENKEGAFVVTWALNFTEQKSTRDSYIMPFNTNNIDLTVSSNVIYGLTSAILEGLRDPSEWFDSEVQMIYENTTDLLAWEINHNFTGRPDLALTYYPSVLNFYWFMARTLNLIQSYMASHHGNLPYPVMNTVREKLLDSMRNVVSPNLIKMARPDQQEGTAYFDDFLGNDDKDVFGKPVNHAQDRIFSTAMAMNVLLYTWMEGDTLLAETPAAVKETVGNASQWLLLNTLSGKYKPWNAVFSGSVKGVNDLPFFYPANVLQYLNGSALPSNTTDADVSMVVGVNGTIPRAIYADMLKEKHFGLPTPLDFHGYNLDKSFWPFWCSEPWTYASVMLALTQYRALVASGQL